jgi:ppGpp synthetase/RelA/SpoT-type nucleotidyltranferase
MRQIKETPNIEARTQVANEAAYLYAPLAHKLGLYKLKSELEDLSLKYTEHDVYYHIKDKLNETKASRDKYIAAFIEPIQHKLEEAGLKFHMKGRTKSIHSIYQKMKKQKCPFEGVYDLFAIRIILDSPVDKEKQECWQVYSIVTDMYMPNPKRLRDWLSVPKSNGYESLHTTVMGPEGKWVEVQIRTERMDEIAERGLAAHWRYKGVKGESGLEYSSLIFTRPRMIPATSSPYSCCTDAKVHKWFFTDSCSMIPRMEARFIPISSATMTAVCISLMIGFIPKQFRGRLPSATAFMRCIFNLWQSPFCKVSPDNCSNRL